MIIAKYALLLFSIVILTNCELEKTFSYNQTNVTIPSSNAFSLTMKKTSSEVHLTSTFNYLPEYIINLLQKLFFPRNNTSNENNHTSKGNNNELIPDYVYETFPISIIQSNTINTTTTKKVDSTTTVTTTTTTKKIDTTTTVTTTTTTKKVVKKTKTPFIEDDSYEIKLTKNATKILNEIEKRILIKEGKIKTTKKPKKKTSKKSNKKNKKSKNKSTTVVRPLEDPNLFQGDILLTEDQAKDLIQSSLEEAKKKHVNVSDINLKSFKNKLK
ncbi:Hypothetical protein SRAE_2000453100 [Strongyloides ratti]|uniref:Uncharacterized protein n=1 Tax=Strongyloides ratti TaxID=34506 RepID=A0A090N013_STRRB|nr:Hypothetical protein SRAE_2000453100 [Strongyloides ratti]CEF69885.1 Hypothetical protein SRAE_2000453100 [Strongyloides ratti]